MTNDNLSALFTVAETPQPSTQFHFAANDEEPTSFANEMMEKLDKFKIKKKLDFDESSQTTIPSVQDDRATCCTLKSFISEEIVSTDKIAPMVMTPSSKWNICNTVPESSTDSGGMTVSTSASDSLSDDSVSLGSLDPKLLGPEMIQKVHWAYRISQTMI